MLCWGEEGSHQLIAYRLRWAGGQLLGRRLELLAESGLFSPVAACELNHSFLLLSPLPFPVNLASVSLWCFKISPSPLLFFSLVYWNGREPCKLAFD